MPAPVDRRGHLVDADEWERRAEDEREARIARFTQRAGGTHTGQRSREAIPLDMDTDEWEPPSVRSHDPHTLEASRARLVESLNSR